MSTMHRPGAASAPSGSPSASRSSSRGAAKPHGSRTWTISWPIAAPASSRGELTWTIDANGTARCQLNQHETARDIGSAHQATLELIDGLMHVTVPGGQDGAPLLTAVLNAATGTLLYARTTVLTALGVLGGRAEPPTLTEALAAVRQPDH